MITVIFYHSDASGILIKSKHIYLYLLSGRFNRPSFGGRRTTAAPAAVEAAPVEDKIEEKEHAVTQAKVITGEHIIK